LLWRFIFQVPFGPTNRSEPFEEQVIEASVLELELINEGVFKSFSVEVVVDWRSLRLKALNFCWTTKPLPKCGSQCLRH
jgi:hypothetical protein